MEHIATTLIITSPAIIAAISAAVLAWRAGRKVDDNTAKTIQAANALSKQNNSQSVKLQEVSDRADVIAEAVNGNLDKRFEKIEKHLQALMVELGEVKKKTQVVVEFSPTKENEK